MATIPSANGLTTSQYLRYLQALSLWNNLQENQRRNYPSVGEMYAYQFPQMLNTLGKQVGDVFAAQGRDQQAAATLANTQAETGYRTAATQSLQDQRYLDQLKFLTGQQQAQRAREAEAALYQGLKPQTVPGQTFTSMEEQPPESYGGMGAEPPVTAPQSTTTPPTTTTPTLMDVIRGMGKQAADLPEKYTGDFFKALLPKEPAAPPATITPGHGVRNAQGGYDVPVPSPLQGEALKADILRRIDAGEPVSDAARVFAGVEPKPTTPKTVAYGSEINAALGQLGVKPEDATADDIKAARKLVQQDNIAVAGTKAQTLADIRANAQANKPLTPKERNEQSREQNFLSTYDRLETIAKAHPEWFGPYGTLGYIEAAKLGAGSGDPAFGDFQSLVQQVGVERMHDLFGARLTQQEVTRYRESHPAMGQSQQQFLARLRAARGQMQNVYDSRWGGGGSSGGDSGPLNGGAESMSDEELMQAIRQGRGRR